MSLNPTQRFRTILTARLLLEYREQWLYLEQTLRNGGGFTFPGGKIEGEEFAKAALVREVFEEIGLVIPRESLKLVHITQRKIDSIVEIIFFFKSKIWSGELQVREPLKFNNAIWLPMDEPPKKLTAVLAHSLARIEQGKLYSEFTKEKEKQKQEAVKAAEKQEKAAKIAKAKKAKVKAKKRKTQKK